MRDNPAMPHTADRVPTLHREVVHHIEAGPVSTNRGLAHVLVQGLPRQLAGQWVWLSLRELLMAAPDFMDELVVELLERRHADHLVVTHALDDHVPTRVARTALRASAVRHQVSERLSLVDPVQLRQAVYAHGRCDVPPPDRSAPTRDIG